MADEEGDFLKRACMAASELGARLFRQNTGMGWVGKPIKKTPQQLTLQNPRPLHAGLCTGSSDLIGWTPVVVTPDMVGKTVAIFTAIEAKTANVRATAQQENFLRVVREHGGIGAVCYTPGEVVLELEKAMNPNGAKSENLTPPG